MHDLVRRPSASASAVVVAALAVLWITGCSALRRPDGGRPSASAGELEIASTEEASAQRVLFTRRGHADVHAKERSFTWRFQDADDRGSISVRVVMIDPTTREPTELFRSDEPEGTVRLEQFRRGPGLYAILAVPRDKPLTQAQSGLRLAYTEVRRDCPEVEAWWPSNRPARQGR